MAFLFNKFQEVRFSPLRISQLSPDLDLLGSRWCGIEQTREMILFFCEGLPEVKYCGDGGL